MVNLRKFRIDKKMTQKEMAVTLGVTLSLYEKIEGGRANASAGFMKKFKNKYPETIIDDIFFMNNEKA